MNNMDCPVCYYPFDVKDNRIPKILNKCGHTLCQTCLSAMYKNNQIKCPFCKEVYNNQNLQDFPNNFIIMQQIESQKKPTINPRKKVKTFNLSDDSEECLNNKEKLNQFDGICVEHNDKKYEFYCKNCKLYLCKKCLKQHQGHTLDDLEDVQENILKINQNNEQEITDLNRNVNQLKTQFEFMQRDFQQHNQEHLQQAEEDFNSISQMLIEKKEEIFNEFYESVSDQEKKIKGIISKLSDFQTTLKQQQEKILQSGQQANYQSLDILYKKGLKNYDFTQNIKDLQNNIKEALGFDPKQAKEVIQNLEKEKQSQFEETGSKIILDLDNISNSISTFASVNSNSLNQNKSDDMMELQEESISKSEQQQNRFSESNQLNFQNVNTILKQKQQLKQQQQIGISNENTTNSTIIQGNQQLFSNQNSNMSLFSQMSSSTNNNNIRQNMTGQTPYKTPGGKYGISLTNQICWLGSKHMLMFDVVNKQWNKKDLVFQYQEQQRENKQFSLKMNGQVAYISGNKVFYCGGGPTNSAYILEFQEQVVKVHQLPQMNQKRIWHQIYYIRPYVYVIGGYDGTDRLSSCERIDIFKKEKFEKIDSMSQDRSLFASCHAKGYIYVFGGLTGRNGRQCTSIEKFDVIKNKWELLRIQLPKSMSGMSAVLDANCENILLFGGSVQGKTSKNILEFNLQTQKIRQKVTQMAQKRQNNNNIVNYKGDIYLIGGNFNYSYEIYNCQKQQIQFDENNNNYANFLKNDLNNYSMFTTFNNFI